MNNWGFSWVGCPALDLCSFGHKSRTDKLMYRVLETSYQSDLILIFILLIQQNLLKSCTMK